MEGYFSCKVRPMEGRLVLHEGGDKEEMKDLAELAPKWLRQWFEDIKPWNPRMVARERNVWGKFISTDDSTSKKKRFDIGRILISTPIMEFISKSMNIRVNGVPFFIKVMEEEATNGIFSMTSDHVFKESIDSEDSSSEMWSLYNDIDGAVDESIQGDGCSVQGGGCSKHSSKCANGKVEDDDKERRANVESKNVMVDDVEFEYGREREESRLDSQGKKATARQKIFEFENVENSLMSAEESIKQSDNECIAAGIENTRGLLINTQGETAEEVGYVSDSLCEHLRQSQEQDLKRGKGELIRPTNPSPSKNQRGERGLRPDHQACLGDGEIWATNLGPGAAKKNKVSKDKGAGVEREKRDDMCEKEGEKQRGEGIFDGVETDRVGKEGKKKGVKELVAQEKVEFLSVPESKVKVVDAQLCRALWGSDNFEWVAQPSKEWQRPVLDGIEFKKISTEEGSMLEAPFKEEEVKQAVWSCESSKAPRPDGFNFKFIKEMWEVIKGDILGFVDDFQKHGKLVGGVNSSFIVLIPKVDNPQKIEEFRPISLVGVMYKVIAKLLAHKLSSILNGVIGENQMAFIGGRQLANSVVIVNETIDEAQKGKKAGFIFKLDFEKAYDKVCWAFLDYMMMRLGFGQKWKGWMTECLKTTEVSVLLNGSTTRQFKMQRGLRQGDPLSPFLFLIIAEGLNGIIKSAISHGLFEGITVGQSGLKAKPRAFPKWVTGTMGDGPGHYSGEDPPFLGRKNHYQSCGVYWRQTNQLWDEKITGSGGMIMIMACIQ
ncbi:hypothetical protein SLEP1_g56348 [Rubroshorea leprosula]|uniref:Reverse transcriptase domain-containing protein n=1 Tax=Rubroshorea leprosula TaxID=152421 RepID=A0AAV5MJC3_9ROSI|nr:hypothetical protein SLEP1_g56348 [Rubroshorea leprosula]